MNEEKDKPKRFDALTDIEIVKEPKYLKKNGKGYEFEELSVKLDNVDTNEQAFEKEALDFIAKVRGRVEKGETMRDVLSELLDDAASLSDVELDTIVATFEIYSDDFIQILLKEGQIKGFVQEESRDGS